MISAARKRRGPFGDAPWQQSTRLATAVAVCAAIGACGDENGESAPSCDARIDAAKTAAKESLAAAETRCAADADCTLVPNWNDSNRCTRYCTSPASINVAAAEQLLERYAEIDQTHCQDFGLQNQPCFQEAVGSSACASPWIARCTAGTCETASGR